VVVDFLQDRWSKYNPPACDIDLHQTTKTGFESKRLGELAQAMNTLPEDRKYFRKVTKLMKERLKMVAEDRLDWAMGEMLAYATLLDEGHPVRISGQDVERGTFSHRHAVVKTEDSEEEIIPLNTLREGQGEFQIYNSPLSEYGVCGFDYGYAFARPEGLTVWEAQFGDFNNGAQILFDQFLSAAEDKWRTMNGLTLLLPHGFEGMGSEHSSGRMERFLQLCSGDNMFVANCTTPANYFHLLRRQVKHCFRKPLLVFTPKKLLRYPRAVSTMKELSHGAFQAVIDDPRMKTKKASKAADTIIMCTGKIYYDLLEQLDETPADNLAFVRFEQLHPFPQANFDSIVDRYGSEANYIWVQEEPENMGAWTYMLQRMIRVPLSVISRPISASPASGSSDVYTLRQRAIVDAVFQHGA
jgi:2-oxoglutarate dehydrogenase E1 component